MERPELHKSYKLIQGALDVLVSEADNEEDGRIKAITITKLQEALLWANEIYPKRGNLLNASLPNEND